MADGYEMHGASAPSSLIISNTERPGAVDWVDQQSRIRELYIDQDLPLKEVMEIMRKTHGVSASSKAYKAHLKRWGYRKNIRTAGKLDEDALEAALFEALHGPGHPTEVRLADGQVVARQRLATHLLRKTKGSSYMRHSKAPQIQGTPTMIRPPDTLYIIESLLDSARTYVMYQHESAAATPLFPGPSHARKLSPAAYDNLRAAQVAPRDHWMHFVYGVKNALEENKFNLALVLMRQAPAQLDLWMRGRAINVLSGLLMFTTYCARFCASMERWKEEEFLKVMKALMKYGDQAAVAQDGVPLSRAHPLRRALQVLSTVDTNLFRQASQKAWALSLYTQDEAMGSSGSIVSIKDWTLLNTSTTEMEYPPDFERVMDEALRTLEVRLGESHHECMDLLWRKAIYLIEKDEAQGVNPVLNASHLVIMREIIRRGSKGKPRCCAFRFFAEHHRALGEKDPALKNLRESIHGLMEIYGGKDILVMGFVSELRDWLLEWEDLEEAATVGKWLEELQRAAKLEVANL